MTRPVIKSAAGYAEQAPALLDQYEQYSFVEIHTAILEFLPVQPCAIVDIGAGTGRDAGWFDEQGHDVVAIEPTRELREPAQKLHPSPRINWLDDSLPDLTRLRTLGRKFDIVMMTAVWMHLDKGERETAMSSIAEILAPQARVFISLRHGTVPKGRRMFDVSAEETIELAAGHGLVPLFNGHVESTQSENKAAGIGWTKLVFELRL